MKFDLVEFAIKVITDDIPNTYKRQISIFIDWNRSTQFIRYLVEYSHNRSEFSLESCLSIIVYSGLSLFLFFSLPSITCIDWNIWIELHWWRFKGYCACAIWITIKINRSISNNNHPLQCSLAVLIYTQYFHRKKNLNRQWFIRWFGGKYRKTWTA